MKNSRQIAFLFSGIACQWKTMGRELFNEAPGFRQAIEDCDAAFKPYSKWSIIEEIQKDEQTSRLHEAAIAHACIFSIETGLVNVLKQWGLQPDALIGHSAGEVAAAHAAGILDLDDAFKIIWNHCVYFFNNPEATGKMGHVSLSLDDMAPYLLEFKDDIIVSGENSPKSTLISGNQPALERLFEKLKARDVFCRILNVDVPFHHPVIEPYLDDFHASIADVHVKTATIPVYSFCNGRVTTENPFDIDYWPHNVRDPIMFRYCVEKMLADGIRIFVEVSPHPVLSQLVQETAEAAGVPDIQMIPTLKRAMPEKNELITTWIALENAGISLSGAVLTEDERQRLRIVSDAGQKAELQSTAANASRSPVSWTDDTLVQLVKAGVYHATDGQINPGDVPDRGFFDMGLDSISAIRLKNYLSDALNLPLNSTVVFDYPNIRRLSEYLKDKHNRKLSPGSSVFAAHPSRAGSGTVPASQPVAIVSMACRYPGGANSVELFWDFLTRGGDAVTEVPEDRWDIDAYYDSEKSRPGKCYTRKASFFRGVDISTFDASFFNLSPKEAASLDPQQRLLLEVTWEALERGGILPSDLADRKVGVYLGISTEDYKGAHLWSNNIADVDPYSLTGSLYCCAGGRISYFFGLSGPNISVDTACSSSLTAVHLAVQALRAGECDLAIAAGVNCLLTPNLFVFFSQVQALSPDGTSRAFDASADGYGRGEGCGVIILQRLNDARNSSHPILALVRGSAVNQDGASSSFTTPNGTAQQAVIRAALDDAGITPDQVDYIEAHATGTKLGDPIEVSALNEVYGKARRDGTSMTIGSVKTNIGHLEAAAGLAGVIKVALMMQNQSIPPHLHLKTPNPYIPWQDIPFTVPMVSCDWPRSEKPRIAGVSAFGFSGTNAHVIIEEAPAHVQKPAASALPAHILNVSAKNEEALKSYAQAYVDYLSGNGDIDIQNVCYTANTARTPFSHRLSVVGRTGAEIVSRLETFLKNRGTDNCIVQANRGIKRPRIAFLFSGSQVQYCRTGRDLYETIPAFKNAINECSRRMKNILQIDLAELIYGDEIDENRINHPDIAPLILFSIQYGLTCMWRSWGVVPDVVLGQGIGALAAAQCAGRFSFEDAAKILTSGKLAAGSILCPGCEGSAVSQYFKVIQPEDGRKPSMFCIGGDSGNEKPKDQTGADDSRPNPVIQSVESGRASASPDDIEADIFLEIGHTPVLIPLMKETIGKENILFLPSLVKSRPGWDTIMEAIAGLYANGGCFDWGTFYNDCNCSRVPLPTYPFQRKKYWINPVKSIPLKGSADTVTTNGHPLIGKRMSSPSEEIRYVNLIQAKVLSSADETAGNESPGFSTTLLTDMGAAVSKELFGEKGEIRNFKQNGAGETVHEHDAEVQCIASPGKDGAYRLSIYSRKASVPNASWVLHASMDVESSNGEKSETMAVVDIPGELSGLHGDDRLVKLIFYLKTWVIQISGHAKVEDISADIPLMTQGFDSLMAVQFRDAIENHFKITLPVSFMFNYPDIEEIAKYLDHTLFYEPETAEEAEVQHNENVSETDFAFLDTISPDEFDELIRKEIDG